MAAKKPAEKPTFVWEGTNREGKKVKGETQGANIGLVKAELRRQGFTPKTVKKNPNHYWVVVAVKKLPLPISLFSVAS